MNTLSEQLDSEVFPALFHVLPHALPEFGFTKTAQGYKSTSGWKVTHEQGDSKNAVYVYENNRSYLNDWTRSGKSIYSYIKERDSLDTHSAVVRRLAELAGVTLTEQQYSPEEAERFEKARRIAEAWEATNEFCISCLSSDQNDIAKTMRASKVRDYLTIDRGYSAGLFRLSGQSQDRDTPKMELGYMPELGELAKHLRNKDFTQEEINTIVAKLEKAGTAIGQTHVLSFPYRDHRGTIRGMVFRAIDRDVTPKYLYSSFNRSEVLFNLKALSKDTDLVIVESPLDAMHATALGIKSITALGGSGGSLNKQQVELAIKYGTTKITLLLDNDSQDGVERAGIKGTDSALSFLQKEYPNLPVYVGQFPEGIKDLDELLVKQGVEGYNRVKSNAIPAWAYLQERIFTRYNRLIDPETGELSFKDTRDLEVDLIETAARLSLLDSDHFTNAYMSSPAIQELGITRATVEAMTKAIRESRFNKEQSERAQNLLRDAKKEIESGQTVKALNLLEQRTKELKARNKADSFAALSRVTTEQQLKDSIRNRPEPLESGYTIDMQPLMIPAAAISILAGSTSHGKSILIANLALNLAELYPDKTFHIFSYEVDQERYLVNLLNPYIGDDLLAYNNRESIEHYFRGKNRVERKGASYPLFKDSNKEAYFNEKKAEFFTQLIDSGRVKVHYVSYDSDELIEAIRYLNTIEPVGAILVDYVQLIYTPTGKLRNPSRQEEIKQMCIDFKDLAIETGLPLVFGAQFNREVNNLAQMHATKLGEAGDLERIADLILGIWNNSRKNTGTPSKAELITIEDRVGVDPNPYTWYIEVLKRRGGRVEVWDIWDYKPNAAKVQSNSGY